MRLRKGVASQRLLARLMVIAPDSWMLKGGLALDFRLADRAGPHPRATKDMDLARAEGVEAADGDFQSARQRIYRTARFPSHMRLPLLSK